MTRQRTICHDLMSLPVQSDASRLFIVLVKLLNYVHLIELFHIQLVFDFLNSKFIKTNFEDFSKFTRQIR